MRTTFALLAAALLFTSGCTVQRTLAIGSPALTHEALPGAEPLPWRLGTLHVSVEGMSVNGVMGTKETGVDYGPYKQQLSDRLKATLVSQGPLGATTGAASHSLEVEVKAREVYGMGRQMWLSLVLESLVLAAGFGTGLAVDAATAKPGQPSTMTGFLVGGLGSVPLALGVATLPQLAGANGTFEAELVLRRLSDRVPIAQRRVESTWRADYNVYQVPQKLAAASGQGVAVFERELLSALAELLQECQSTPSPAPAAQ